MTKVVLKFQKCLILNYGFMDVHMSACIEVCMCVRDRRNICVLGVEVFFAFFFSWQRNQNRQRDIKRFARAFIDNPFSHFRKATLEKRYIKF